MKPKLTALVMWLWITLFAALLMFAQVARATSISLSGTYSYQYSGQYVVMTADRVTNNEFGGRSGTLRMELWAFPSPYTGASQTGYQLATYTLGELYGGEYFYDISSGWVPVYYPPSGTWYISLIITEYNYGSWPSVDHGTFSGTLVCSSGYCSNVSSAPTPIRSPVYRFVNIYTGGHFFTISETEKNDVLQNKTWFKSEGVGFDAYPTQAPGTLPVYRFYNTAGQGYFYTIYESEKNNVIQNLKAFAYEGIAFYAYPTKQSGTLPIYRFQNTRASAHFFTIYENEKDTVIQNYNWFLFEGVSYYVYLRQSLN